MQQKSSPKQMLKAENEIANGRMTVTVEQAAHLLGISRASAYGAASSGELPVIRIGKRLLVPKAALNRLLAAE